MSIEILEKKKRTRRNTNNPTFMEVIPPNNKNKFYKENPNALPEYVKLVRKLNKEKKEKERLNQ